MQSRLLGAVLAAMLCLLVTIASATVAQAQTLTTLYSFGAANGDGSNPTAPLILDPSGSLYGTTTAGGSNGFGTVFKLTPPASGAGTWSETLLYTFTGFDGATPYAGLISDASGAL